MPIEEFQYLPEENLDWGCARNLRTVLMASSTEWVQSVHSQDFNFRERDYIAPGRDFTYEGLLAHQDGEHWKFIDCIAIGLEGAQQKPLSIIAGTVRCTPWKVVYTYRITEDANDDSGSSVPFHVSYYLHSNDSPKLSTGEVEILFPGSLNDNGLKLGLNVLPFVDIRHMYSDSAFGNYRLENEFEEHRLFHISNYNRRLSFYLPSGELSTFESPQLLNWGYKLGVGSRREVYSHERGRTVTVFEGEEKMIGALFSLSFTPTESQRSFKISFACGLNDETKRPSLFEIQSIAETSREKNRREMEEIKALFPFPEVLKFRDAIWARIVGLLKFESYVPVARTGEYTLCPTAGAWWFKTPWYRDVFEGLLNSFETLMKLPRSAASMKEIISLALRYQDEATGLVSTRVPEYNKFEIFLNSTDATLLCFIAANKYIQRTGDLGFAREVLLHLEKTVSSFCQGGGETECSEADGTPRMDQETGLLLSAPHHSWIDTRAMSVEHNGLTLEHLPSRASARFVKDLYDLIGEKEKVQQLLSSPEFFLPEINAQWITMLKGTVETLDLVIAHTPEATASDAPPGKFAEQVRMLLSRAKENYRSVFWNERNGFLYNLVYADRKTKDDIECETAVTGASMLGTDVFTLEELRSVYEHVLKTLLISRRPVEYGEHFSPFGIITKNEDQKVFYNDSQYHSDVLWLKSSPYLIRLLSLLREREMIEDILINTIDHQMTEAAIFYNQEVFSRPCGNNPSPDEKTEQNPVPVKNPIQYWSQWCDAFVEFYLVKEN
jgi:glycogen debranching enzyme